MPYLSLQYSNRHSQQSPSLISQIKCNSWWHSKIEIWFQIHLINWNWLIEPCVCKYSQKILFSLDFFKIKSDRNFYFQVEEFYLKSEWIWIYLFKSAGRILIDLLQIWSVFLLELEMQFYGFKIEWNLWGNKIRKIGKMWWDFWEEKVVAISKKFVWTERLDFRLSVSTFVRCYWLIWHRNKRTWAQKPLFQTFVRVFWWIWQSFNPNTWKSIWIPIPTRRDFCEIPLEDTPAEPWLPHSKRT